MSTCCHAVQIWKPQSLAIWRSNFGTMGTCCHAVQIWKPLACAVWRSNFGTMSTYLAVKLRNPEQVLPWCKNLEALSTCYLVVKFWKPWTRAVMIENHTRQAALEGSLVHNTTTTEHVAYGSTVVLRWMASYRRTYSFLHSQPVFIKINRYKTVFRIFLLSKVDIRWTDFHLASRQCLILKRNYFKFFFRSDSFICGYLHSHPLNYPAGMGARQQQVNITNSSAQRQFEIMTTKQQ